MPMWAFDQVIVTPEGETPPDLADPNFSEFGTKRADDRAAFMGEIAELKLRAGPTYTFAFWGISQFLDGINWEVKKIIPFKNLDFNLFCGAPPVRLVLYTLKDDVDGEQRHLQTSKNCYFNLAFWSSKKPPSNQKLRMLLHESESGETQKDRVKKHRKGWLHWISRCFSCLNVVD